MKRAALLALLLLWVTAPALRDPIASDAATFISIAKPLEPRQYAQRATRSGSDYRCLLQLWERESNWNPKADNPHSSAFGIAQMLNEKSKDPYVQIDHGLHYITERYGSACNAWRFWLRHRWY